VILLASMSPMQPTPAPALTVPISARGGTCALSVWLVSGGSGFQCGGSCSGIHVCTFRSQQTNGTVHFHCKCIAEGVPPNPDSTSCTTIATYDTALEVHDHYCHPQACGPESCFKRPLTHTPKVPCFCDDHAILGSLGGECSGAPALGCAW